MSEHQEEIKNIGSANETEGKSSASAADSSYPNTQLNKPPVALRSPAYTNQSKEKDTEESESFENEILGKDFSINKLPINTLKKHGARAMVQENKMFLPENFNPHNIEDQKLFAHEFHHIIEYHKGSEREENQSSENQADAMEEKALILLNGESLKRVIEAKHSNKTLGNSAIKRKPDPFTPTEQEKQIPKNYEKKLLKPKEVKQFRNRLKKDFIAKLLENLTKSEKILAEQLRFIPEIIEQIKVDTAISADLKREQDQLKKHKVGYANRKLPNRTQTSFIPDVPPLHNNPYSGEKSRYEILNAKHHQLQGSLDKLADSHPILFAAIHSNIGSLDKLHSHNKQISQNEGRYIINEIADACDQTRKKALNNEINYLDFTPILEQLKKGDYADKAKELDYVLSIDKEKQKFWDYGKFGLELILAVGSAFLSGGWSVLAQGTSFMMAANDTAKSVTKYKTLNDANKATTGEENKLVDPKDAVQAKADMIVSVGGFIIGYKDGVEVFSYMKNASNLAILKNVAKISVKELDTAADFTKFIKQQGGWQKAAKKLKGNEDLAEKMIHFRNVEFEKIIKVIEDNGGKISRTGTVTKVTSDLDASVLGTQSVKARKEVYAFMKKEYGFNTNEECIEFFDMGLFGESKLKYGYHGIQPKYRKTLRENIAITENSAILNRLRKEALSQGNDAKAAYYSNLLEKGGMKEFDLQVLSERKLDQLNQEIDDLYKKYLGTEDALAEAKIMAELQEKLTMVDISDAAAYHTGAGVYQMNAFRKVNNQSDFLWKKLKKGNDPLVQGEKEQLLMGHFSAYGDALMKFDKDPLGASTVRYVGKYGQRISSALSLLKKRGKVRGLDEQFGNIFKVGDKLKEGMELEVALLELKIPGIQSGDELKAYMEKAMLKADYYINLQVPQLLAGNKKTIEKGGQFGLKPKQALQAQQDVLSFTLYKDAREILGIFGDTAKKKTQEWGVKEIVKKTDKRTKSQEDKKKTKKSRPTNRRKPAEIEHKNTVTLPTKKIQQPTKKAKVKKKTNKPLPYLTKVKNIAKSNSSEAFGLMVDVAMKLAKNGKVRKPNTSIKYGFKTQLLQLKKSINPKTLKGLSTKLDYLEGIVINGFSKDINRIEVQKIFDTIRANIWNMCKDSTAHMVPPSIKNNARSIGNRASKVSGQVNKMIDKGTKPIQNLGDSLFEAGEKTVDMIRPDFTK